MRKNLTLIMMLAAAAWLLSSCSSDTTAPDDPLPTLTNKDVASQAGYLSAAVVEVAPVGLTYQGVKAAAANSDDYYDFPDDGYVQGRVYLEFRLGGPTGDLSNYDVADWAKAWTAEGEPLTIVPFEDATPMELSFTLQSVLDQHSDPRTALVNGGGVLIVGAYSATWTVSDLLVWDEEPYWPQSGSISFTSGGFTATVTFNGTNTATVTVGDLTCDVNLEDGVLSCP